MESYIVRIYRGEKDNPRSLVGIVEEVGAEEKKAFTGLDELWNILNSIKKMYGLSGEDLTSHEVRYEYEPEKRNGVRMKKEIPFVFIHNKQNMHVRTVDFCRYGLCIKISERTPLTVGDVVDIQLRNSRLKAEVRWVDNKHPSATMAGFRIANGTLNLKELKKGDPSK